MTDISRRSLVIGAPAILTAAGLPTAAFAQESADSYPSRDVKFVCAFPAGSGADVYVRFFAEKMRAVMKRTVVVENRVGAIGNMATTYTARAKPDGYTIFVHAPSSLAANMHLFKKPPVDAAKEIQVVAAINIQPFMLTVGAKSQWKTMDELVKAVRAKGDKSSYATTNPTSRVSSAWFKKILDLKAVEVQYRTGADTLNDMNSGVIDYCMHDPVTAIANSNNGRLRILGVTTKGRMKSLPAVPSLHELGATGLDVPGWWGAMVPAATPKPIVDKLNQLWRQVVESDETRQFMAKFGADTWSLSPEEAQKTLIADIAKWGEFIKLAGIEPQG